MSRSARRAEVARRIASASRDPSTHVEFVVGELFAQEVDALIVPFGHPTRAESRVQAALGRLARSSLSKEIEQELRRFEGSRLPATESIVTGSHGLACKRIVHTQLVPARVAAEHAEEILERTMSGAFAACRKEGARTVALPAMGTGSYGYGVTEVAEASLRAALLAELEPDGPESVRFVLANPSTLAAFLHAMSRVKEALAEG